MPELSDEVRALIQDSTTEPGQPGSARSVVGNQNVIGNNNTVVFAAEPGADVDKQAYILQRLPRLTQADIERIYQIVAAATES